MFVHRVRKLNAQEQQDFSGCECNFGHWNDHQRPPATHRVFGTEGGHRVGNICCDRCAAELRQEVRSRPATPVTHGHDDATYDGRADFISPLLKFKEP